MNDTGAISEAFSDLVRKEIDIENFYSMRGTVSNVNSTTRTCDFTPIEGQAKRTGIRLQSVLSETKGVVLIPTDGTTVIVTFEDRKNGFVSAMAELDSIQLEAGGKNFKTIMNTFITDLKAAIILTPSGPGSFSAATQVKFTTFNDAINNIFI